MRKLKRIFMTIFYWQV